MTSSSMTRAEVLSKSGLIPPSEYAKQRRKHEYRHGTGVRNFGRRTGKSTCIAADAVAALHNDEEYKTVLCVARTKPIAHSLRSKILDMMDKTKLDRQVSLTIATSAFELIGVDPLVALIAADHTLYE